MARKLTGDAQDLTEHFSTCALSHRFRDARVVENVVEVEVDGVRTIQVGWRSYCPMTGFGSSGNSHGGPLVAKSFPCCINFMVPASYVCGGGYDCCSRKENHAGKCNRYTARSTASLMR